MKKLFSIFTLASMVALLTTFWSCESKEDNTGVIAQVTATGNADLAFPATSIGIRLNLASIESYVYVVTEGENAPAPDPEIAFAEGVKHAAKDGELFTYIYGVEGNKAYTVHFIFKVLGQGKLITQSISSKTADYTRLINIVAAERFEIKVHFKVPAGQYFRYVIVPKSDALSGDDLNKLKDGVIAQGPQTITYRDGGPTGFVDPETGKEALALVKPGGVFLVKMTYCDKDGNIRYTGGDQPSGPQQASSNQPMENGYSEECDQTYYEFSDPYARTEVIAAQPATGEGTFAIESYITELSSIFRITPPESVKKFGAVIMDIKDYDEQVAAFGEAGVMEYIQRNLRPLTGVTEISNQYRLEKGVTYRLVLIGQCDDKGDTQIRNIHDFKALESTKPAVELVVTEITDQTDGPYRVRFNVKAPNKDCFAAKYILNYVKEVEAMIGSGMNYDLIMFEYGKPMAEELITAINSADGLDLGFDTFEDMDNRIIIGSFNTDEKVKTFHADSRSAAEAPKTKVNSSLFTDLLGTWEVTAKYHYTQLEEPQYETSTFLTTITAGPEAADPTFVENNETYETVLEWFRVQEEIKGTPKEQQRPNAIKALNVELVKYKEAAPKFAKKYSDQNRLVLNGFEFQKGGIGLGYLSSWDLFCSTTYASYDVDQLFFDYGPKLFFEIWDGDRVTLETNQRFIAPFNYHDGHYLAGGFANNTAAYGQFPVTVVDANNLVIKNETVVENLKFPFAMINGTNNMSEVIFDADITLRRVTNREAIVGKNAKKAPYAFHQSAQIETGKTLKRTKLYHRDPKSIKAPLSSSTSSIAIPFFKGIAK